MTRFASASRAVGVFVLALSALVPLAAPAVAAAAPVAELTDQDSAYVLSMGDLATRTGGILERVSATASNMSDSSLGLSAGEAELLQERAELSAIKSEWDSVAVPPRFAAADAKFGPVIKTTISAVDLEIRMLDTFDVAYGQQGLALMNLVPVYIDAFTSAFYAALLA
jgi:hypothetical protein